MREQSVRRQQMSDLPGDGLLRLHRPVTSILLDLIELAVALEEDALHVLQLLVLWPRCVSETLETSCSLLTFALHVVSSAAMACALLYAKAAAC